MGLKSKLNKMKNFLFDEEEIDKPKEKKIKIKNKDKKEIEKEDISTKSVEKENNFDDFYFDDISDKEVIENTVQVKSRVTKESEFKFPEFNDDDFMTPVRETVKVEVEKKEEVKPVLYQGSKRREETKKFKPSPMISPIYGLLNNQGSSVNKIDEKSDVTKKTKEDTTFDEIRKKAYGSLDKEFENTMSRLSKKTIEEAEADMEKEEKEIPLRSEEKSKISHEKAEDTYDDNDDMVLPNVNFKEIDIDKEGLNKKRNSLEEDDDDEDTKEQDLFNLIDTIYSGEEKDN